VELTSLSGGATNRTLLGFGDTSDTQRYHNLNQQQVTGTEVYRISRADSSVVARDTTFPFPVSAASDSGDGYWRNIFTLIFSGTTVTLRRDGIVTSISATSLDLTSVTLTKFTLGAMRRATTTNYCPMKFRRLVVSTSTALSAGTCTTYENYMKQDMQLQASPKKGIVYGGAFSRYSSDPDPAYGAMQRLGIRWYANYTVTPWGRPTTNSAALVDAGSSFEKPPGVEYVSQVFGLAAADSAQNLTWAQTYSSRLIGFNEPDNNSITVAQAIARWPLLVATGLLLGAPPVAANADQTSGWLHDFMTHASAPHVDFLPVHYYVGSAKFSDPATATSDTLNYCLNTNTLYGKPVWLHEFGMLDFGSSPWGTPTQSQYDAFLQRLIPWLEAYSTTRIQRWSQWTLGPAHDSSLNAYATQSAVQQDAAYYPTGTTYSGLGLR